MSQRSNATGLKRPAGLAAILVPMFLMACGPADVSVFVALGDDAEPEPLGDIEVQILPYDRDQIFDSLESVAAMPEPQMPEDLIAARDEIAAAQDEWRTAESRWGEVRDRLQAINAELETLNTAERRYRELFLEFEDLDAERARVERTVGTLFDRFTELQQASIGRIDSVKVVQDDWANQAFEDFGAVRDMKVELAGLEAHYDTTGAEGVADFMDGVVPGEYWVHARYRLVYDELYWNVPVMVTRDSATVVRLHRENAEVRPVY